MKEQEIYNHQLAIRYFEGRITPSEEEILFRFVNDAPSNEKNVPPMGGGVDAFL